MKTYAQFMSEATKMKIPTAKSLVNKGISTVVKKTNKLAKNAVSKLVKKIGL